MFKIPPIVNVFAVFILFLRTHTQLSAYSIVSSKLSFFISSFIELSSLQALTKFRQIITSFSFWLDFALFGQSSAINILNIEEGYFLFFF